MHEGSKEVKMTKLKNNKNINPVPKPKKKRAQISDRKLLRLWSQAVIERAGHKCEYPDCRVNWTQLQAHHLYSKSSNRMRYNLDAGMALCHIHHTNGPDSAHKDPDFKERIILTKVRTRKLFEDLKKESLITQSRTEAFKREALEKLKPYIKD